MEAGAINLQPAVISISLGLLRSFVHTASKADVSIVISMIYDLYNCTNHIIMHPFLPINVCTYPASIIDLINGTVIDFFDCRA